jgi:hydrogenase nickel incorporation protein HypA/HybF
VHELAVTESLLELALRHAAAAGGGRVTDLYLVIGQLSSVVDDSVQFYWDFVSAGTPAEGARLHFERVAAEFECGDCSARYGISGEALACPVCGGGRVSVRAGDEFHLAAIDVDDCLQPTADGPPVGAAGARSEGR